MHPSKGLYIYMLQGRSRGSIRPMSGVILSKRLEVRLVENGAKDGSLTMDMG